MTSEKEQRKSIQTTQRRAIIGSILASLIVIYFLDPILSFLGRLTLRVAGDLFTAYLDRLYAEVAVSELNFGFLFFAWIASIFLGCTIGFILSKSGIFKKRKSSTPPARLSRFIAIVLCIISVLLLALTVDSYIRLKTASTFNQRLTVITPLISDQERKEFLAGFASMESKGDFEAVMRSMDKVAEKNNIKLPKNRLYPY
jgi:hypothetical protein